VSRDVTFHEHESYFRESHLQGESITKEDEPLREDEPLWEDELLIFSRPGINPCVVNVDRLENSPTQLEIGIQLEIETTITKTQPEIEPQQIESQFEIEITNGRKIGKNLVHSRRKTRAIPVSSHVQESNPVPLYEVTSTSYPQVMMKWQS